MTKFVFLILVFLPLVLPLIFLFIIGPILKYRAAMRDAELRALREEVEALR